jgi:phosphohistidine phosphatase
MKRQTQRPSGGAPAPRLWLVRHAHALDGADDAARPLSPKGRAQVRRLAGFLRASGAFAPEEIWHSGLLRANETAELLVQRLELAVPLREKSGLAPADDPAVIARRLEHGSFSLAVVGHEPHLSALASLLVAGEAEPPVVEMKKCSVLALERTAGRWIVRWLVSPVLLG